MNRVGLKIRKLRNVKGISQEYMADEMEISQCNYGRKEKDDNRLTVPKLRKIAKVLNVSIAELFADDHGTASINAIEDKDHVHSLKEEINFLRRLLEQKGK
jgi:transcriptional regulator with XRE-family HTH domain